MIHPLGEPSFSAPHHTIQGRREFLQRFELGPGCLSLADLPEGPMASQARDAGVLETLHHPPRAKRVSYLFQSGGPSQLESFDYKPSLVEQNDQQRPDSVRQCQRLTGMTSSQASLPTAGSQFKFAHHVQATTWISELLTHTAQLPDATRLRGLGIDHERPVYNFPERRFRLTDVFGEVIRPWLV